MNALLLVKQHSELMRLYPFPLKDFNECNLNNAGCEHVCNNTGGSFNCDCRSGFQLKADKRGCEGKFEILQTPWSGVIVQ